MPTGSEVGVEPFGRLSYGIGVGDAEGVEAKIEGALLDVIL